MADSNGNSSTPWLAFLAGIVVVALLVAGFFAFVGAPQQETAELNIDVPNIEAPDINPPDVNPPELPEINPPEINPPAAEDAP